MQYYYTLIIPHYNIPKLLRRLLRTVPRRDDLQVIVVDDCSTKELEELESVKQEFPWIEWYDTGTNGGGGKARNIALRFARGKYVLFADADDFFTPGISNILDNYHDILFDMVIFRAISLSSENYAIESRSAELNCWIKIYKTNKERGLIYLKYVFGEPWCRLISLDLIRKYSITFDEIKCHNDTHFSYLAGFYSSKVIIDETVGYVITMRPQSVIYTKFKDRTETVVKVFSEKQKFFDTHGIKIDVSDLYNPLAAALLKFDLGKFMRIYSLIKEKSPELPRKFTIIKFIPKLLIYKLLGERHPQLIK